ncbi:MAG: DUF362 domain-containing protein [Anaerolineae bacterium]|nr:DUF362 domain-containing protein [Anaerolineae bacterium]NIN94153.1 DUF362 domain-containing protein [Anaerolineae bacterium]NIQ77195.1 DUF362 domain-containing protein [Anaerolineae bacterium]
MSQLTRRQFLRRLGAGVGALVGGWFLAACGTEQEPTPAEPQAPPTAPPKATPPAEATSPPTPTVGETAAPTPTTGETAAPSPTQAEAPTATATPSPGPPDLVVARGGEPEELVRRALAALGGMQRFVQPGYNVIIKPNICVAYHTYEYAATTNPWVVGALVKLCFEAGARSVRVMDYPFGGTPEEAYLRSGIEEQVRAVGGQMEIMAFFKFIATDIPEGRDLRTKDIYDEVLNADLVINVPIAKHHNLAKLTLGMKNLMGVITNRSAMHGNLGQRLADLTSRVRPGLTVVDAVRVLVANGPTGGNLNDVRKLDTVIASPDIVAADSYAATLFGVQPMDLDYVRAATEMGLGRSDLGNLRIEEI